MKDYIRFIDGLPWILRLIFAFPIFDGLFYGIYRVSKGLVAKDNMLVLIGIIWIFAGIAILWIIDLISVIMNGKVIYFV